jgi:hypothetical protein
MKLKKFSRFALILGGSLILAGLSWILTSRRPIFSDSNFPAVIYSVSGMAILIYTLRTIPLLNKRVYEHTQSIDNDLLFTSSENFVVKGVGTFNFILAVLSAFGLIGAASLSLYFLGWFLDRPRLSRINEPDEIIGFIMAIITAICVVPSFLYVLRTYDRKHIYDEQ